MKKYIFTGVMMLAVLLTLHSCKNYLDVVPDNVATIDNAFTMRSQAEKFLFTCFSYMPKDADAAANPALAGDEIWRVANNTTSSFNIAKGLQNVVSPYGDDYWTNLYRGLRDCNIFLENIGKVPDLDELERSRWIAEAKFLKAYYHFYLIRMYGPIPLIKENLPVDADVNQVKVFRASADECFSYVTSLIDEAITDLPESITNAAMYGRITKAIAYSLKAKILVTAASPLFNGNADQAGLKNSNGELLFNSVYDKGKWTIAATACKKAIEVCEAAGMKLFYFQPNFEQADLSPMLRTQMSIRNSIAQKWNSEIIWANTQSEVISLQTSASPKLDPAFSDNTAVREDINATLKMAELFYTKNGVPIREDNTFDYNNRTGLRTAGAADQLLIRNGYTTASLNFDREPRFYADLGFDGGVWYGQGKFNDKAPLELFYVMGKRGQLHGMANPAYGPITGYSVKKYVHYQNVQGSVSVYFLTSYPWPLMRLADLYLLYAEALNESEGPGPEVYKYVNLVRERAGLKSVESSWSQFSSNPTKFETPAGMKEIIHQERLIEMAFEGQRFWDLRRWKEAAKELNTPVQGWGLSQETAAAYYRPVTIYRQTFGVKDYFWPISENNLTGNFNLVQNTGW
ncbi:MAG TPA: RagB/SusD family nutrient uptake outer membrane protein [Pedobacter sp.]|uniref:RagB/SusD family nutrient uptake outer membrane protein n=1 Tax=Pedobacter sp. TaxID=1411316 RepID=UPI002C2A9EC8|nr:RagB/SusD family nutrient uptake outer membrane protein [Pedobacter sp.]HMI02905.1 RagB/SusD family nutrient uptake outer membrane protein [Pedobacter sp.]